MAPPVKYRTLLLALVFAAFNIGLPVVLDTCPMAKMGNSGACAACHNESRPETATIGLPGGSCCVTVVVGDRNTNEFEQSRNRGADNMRAMLAGALIDASPLLAVQFASVVVAAPVVSPPVAPDIPILTSSLLI